ncbi:MAG: hypothetical protein H7A55_08825 [Verrucomicrobiaceae bacterium]|nr:hypothetical protein [Verrucomicrobiaceae bacterium]
MEVKLMPTLLKISIFALGVVVAGILFAFGAPASDGWGALGNFAIGSVIVAVGLLSSLLTAILCAVYHPLWRRAATWLTVVTLVLVVGSIVIWRIE